MRPVRIIFTCPWKYSAPVLTPACMIAISCPVISASNTSTSSSLLLFWDNSFHRSVPPSTYCAHFSQWGLDMKRIKECGGANKTRHFLLSTESIHVLESKVFYDISETSVIRTLSLCCPYYEHFSVQPAKSTYLGVALLLICSQSCAYWSLWSTTFLCTSRMALKISMTKQVFVYCPSWQDLTESRVALTNQVNNITEIHELPNALSYFIVLPADCWLSQVKLVARIKLNPWFEQGVLQGLASLLHSRFWGGHVSPQDFQAKNDCVGSKGFTWWT